MVDPDVAFGVRLPISAVFDALQKERLPMWLANSNNTKFDQRTGLLHSGGKVSRRKGTLAESQLEAAGQVIGRLLARKVLKP